VREELTLVEIGAGEAWARMAEVAKMKAKGKIMVNGWRIAEKKEEEESRVEGERIALLDGKLRAEALLYSDRSSTNSRAVARSKCANAPLPSPSKRFERRTAALALFRGEHHR
jgi:hypothetical protein